MNKGKITKKTTIGEIMEIDPALAEELEEQGMFCVGCPMAKRETIEDGAAVHGIDPDELVEKLNFKLKTKK